MGISGSDKALMYALSGVERSGATRSGYVSPKVFVFVDGVQYAPWTDSATGVLMKSLAITEVLHETPNTCRFLMKGHEPTEGQAVIITLGSINNLDRLYAGNVLNRAHSYFQKPINWKATVNAIDYTWLLTRRIVSGSWTNTSATTIANAIIAEVPGVTSGVVAGLATLDAFSFTDISALAALTQLAKRIGGYLDVDYNKVVKLFLTDATVTNPVQLTSAHISLSEFSYTRDLSQVRTRIYVEGGGVNALAPCAVGETIIPVETTAWYNVAGGKIKSGPQHVTYGGVFAGGTGSIVGPGVTPSDAPVVSGAVGTGIDTGDHDYAYVWVTASGKTLPSPTSSFTSQSVAGPSSAPNALATNGICGGTMTVGATYKYLFTWGAENVTDPTHQTAASPAATIVPISDGLGGSGAVQVLLSGMSSSDAAVGRFVVYRTLANGSTYYRLQSFTNGATGSFNDGASDASISGNPTLPSANFDAKQASLTGIAVGPSGTTSRELYRTAAGGSQLKLLHTFADNTTTTYTDSTADASLGANAPSSDTSGLTQPTGQVNPGSTSLIVAGTSFASSTGGWAIIGNGAQVIRYTGFSAGSLTGIPASGVGAILAAVAYNSMITAAPALTGVPASGTGSILYPILQGDPINLLVQCDDAAAQTTLAALIGGSDDGIVEDFIQDGTIGETEAIARGNAQLALSSTVLVSITYKSRDINTHAGRTISVSLGSPTSVTADFLIQRVTIDSFQPALYPTYTVEASSSRWSLEDLLRLVRAKA